jgi:hypothetical protein
MNIHAKQPRVARVKPRRSANKGLRFLAVAAGAGAVIAPATLAFGNAGRHVHGQDAPPSVRNYFSQQNRATAEMQKWERTHNFGARQVPVHVNAARAKSAIEVATSDGLLALWVASAANGHVCWFVGFRADQRSGKPAQGSGTCETAAAPSSKIDWGFGWGAEHPSLKILSGRVYVPANSLLVSDQAGHATRIPVIGSYFLAAFPRSAHTPTKLVALNSNGRAVATFREARHRAGSHR